MNKMFASPSTINKHVTLREHIQNENDSSDKVERLILHEASVARNENRFLCSGGSSYSVCKKDLRGKGNNTPSRTHSLTPLDIAQLQAAISSRIYDFEAVRSLFVSDSDKQSSNFVKNDSEQLYDECEHPPEERNESRPTQDKNHVWGLGQRLGSGRDSENIYYLARVLSANANDSSLRNNNCGYDPLTKRTTILPLFKSKTFPSPDIIIAMGKTPVHYASTWFAPQQSQAQGQTATNNDVTFSMARRQGVSREKIEVCVGEELGGSIYPPQSRRGGSGKPPSNFPSLENGIDKQLPLIRYLIEECNANPLLTFTSDGHDAFHSACFDGTAPLVQYFIDMCGFHNCLDGDSSGGSSGRNYAKFLVRKIRERLLGDEENICVKGKNMTNALKSSSTHSDAEIEDDGSSFVDVSHCDATMPPLYLTSGFSVNSLCPPFNLLPTFMASHKDTTQILKVLIRNGAAVDLDGARAVFHTASPPKPNACSTSSSSASACDAHSSDNSTTRDYFTQSVIIAALEKEFFLSAKRGAEQQCDGQKSVVRLRQWASDDASDSCFSFPRETDEREVDLAKLLFKGIGGDENEIYISQPCSEKHVSNSQRECAIPRSAVEDSTTLSSDSEKAKVENAQKPEAKSTLFSKISDHIKGLFSTTHAAKNEESQQVRSFPPQDRQTSEMRIAASPLYGAVSNKCFDSIKLLIDNGCDTSDQQLIQRCLELLSDVSTQNGGNPSVALCKKLILENCINR